MDIQMNAWGDWTIDDTGDIAVVSDIREPRDDVYFRIRTNNPEYVMAPQVGADLEDIMGMPNTRESAAIGERYIMRALTRDNLLLSENIKIISYPSALDAITFVIIITRPGEQEVRVAVTMRALSAFEVPTNYGDDLNYFTSAIDYGEVFEY